MPRSLSRGSRVLMAFLLVFGSLVSATVTFFLVGGGSFAVYAAITRLPEFERIIAFAIGVVAISLGLSFFFLTTKMAYRIWRRSIWPIP